MNSICREKFISALFREPNVTSSLIANTQQIQTTLPTIYDKDATRIQSLTLTVKMTIPILTVKMTIPILVVIVAIILKAFYYDDVNETPR
ncbi:24352_t:CDS:2 [Dentiscutata erythropus]|uniref:24352_t:CDS:1 n=1 Tax=Dentiscutata erythropus TaxID=1348616 RepID=A0A9N9JSC9_9GLOM|nr:24352_t:CDS:2 [Dentiscutata erythropus]